MSSSPEKQCRSNRLAQDFQATEAKRICCDKNKPACAENFAHEAAIRLPESQDNMNNTNSMCIGNQLKTVQKRDAHTRPADDDADDSPPSSSDDRDYFASYSHLDIHRTMIADAARTGAYRRALLRGWPLIRGRVVLDVGAGTGILSVFCCQAGARHVYAVEASRAAAAHARCVAAENGYADRITVLCCRAEAAQLPEKVDVLVSEWMGHALLYESMLDSVVAARRHWLRPGGVVFPRRAVLKVALLTSQTEDDGVSADAERFWRGVHARYRVHMSCLASAAAAAERRAARVADVRPEHVHSHAAVVCDLDLDTVSGEQARAAAADVTLLSFGAATVTGLVLWFDVEFPTTGGRERLGTSPYDEPTHWGQTVLPLPARRVHQDWRLAGRISLRQNERHPRCWDVDAALRVGDTEAEQTFHWLMDGTA